MRSQDWQMVHAPSDKATPLPVVSALLDKSPIKDWGCSKTWLLDIPLGQWHWQHLQWTS